MFINKGHFHLKFNVYKNIPFVHSYNYNILFSCLFFVMTEAKSIPSQRKDLISGLDANAKTALDVWWRKILSAEIREINLKLLLKELYLKHLPKDRLI
jgi:hypothetical protein